jgi:hypothetical protein
MRGWKDFFYTVVRRQQRMDTPYELYFLRGELPREIAGGYRWSLMAIKVHDQGTYLAFGTSALAELAVQYFASQTVVATSALDDHTTTTSHACQWCTLTPSLMSNNGSRIAVTTRSNSIYSNIRPTMAFQKLSSNSTPHPDARASAAPCIGLSARAGGRGR